MKHTILQAPAGGYGAEIAALLREMTEKQHEFIGVVVIGVRADNTVAIGVTDNQQGLLHGIKTLLGAVPK
jgi:hypothetical protein